MDAASSPHPTREALSSFGLGRLEEPSAEAVSKHLEQCPDCRKQVAEMSADSFLERVRDAQKPEGNSKFGESKPSGAKAYKAANAPSAPPTNTLPPGLAEHPDYEILCELGRGGMGVVYLAQNKLMARKEVLKVVSGNLINRPGVLERFHREIRSAANLHHTNIVTAYSAFREGESIVFAMEYVDGYDLAQLVKGQGPLHVAHACNFVYQTAQGLHYAHEKRMVHRDIKPSNLMVAREGKKPVVKVLDFGLAKATSEGQADSGLTREGQMLGTPDFIAPEQIRDAQSADIRADVYSLGCTLYFLLAGRPPFAGDNLWDLYQAHFSMDAGPLNLVRPEVPVELAALVAKMMAKEPARRFQTPGDVAQALAPFFKPATAQPPGSSAGVSRVNPQAHPTQTSGVSPAPMQPAAPVSTPAALGRKSSKTGTDGVAWETLIAIEEDEPLVDVVKPKPTDPKPAPAEEPVRRPPWMWPAIAAASLFGLIALGVIIITIRGKNGETKITSRDDQSFKVETPEVVVEHNTPSENPAPRTRSITPETVPADNPGTSPPNAPLPAIPNSIGMKMIRIPAGAFMMGSPENDTDAAKNEKPQHRVRITRPFYLGATEVTVGQFRRVMENAGYVTDAEREGGRVWNDLSQRWDRDRRLTWRSPGFEQTDDHPVVQLSWHDAVAFCNRLSELEGLAPYYQQTGEVALSGEGYRLPTEAEWEYACRAGSTTRYSFGDDWASLSEYAWFNANSAGRTHPVGQKRSNAFGLHDMHGNAGEWCSDWHDDDYYRRSPSDDPPGSFPTGAREHRGGEFSADFRRVGSARRWADGPRDRLYNSGFRVARSQSSHQAEQKAAAGAGGLAGRSAFIPLFNGKNLDGWEMSPEYGGGGWKVIDGVLDGGGSREGHATLVTKGRDFRDFRLRVTLMYKEALGTGHIQLRRTETAGEWYGYLVTDGGWWNVREDGQRQIPNQGWFPVIGSIAKIKGAHVYGPWDLLSKPIPYSQGWNVIEISALKNRISTKVNDITVSEYVDDLQPYVSGSIALVCNGTWNVRIRSVEIQEIPSDASGGSPIGAVNPSAGTPPVAPGEHKKDEPGPRASAPPGEPLAANSASPNAMASRIGSSSRAPRAGLFQPSLTLSDTTAWRIGDLSNTTIEESAVTLRAGPNGNFLVTQKDDYGGCSVRVELAASEGADAFLVVRASRPNNNWTAFTSRVFDDRGRIAAGKVMWDFRVDEGGQGRRTFEPAKFFTVDFIAEPPGAFSVHVREQRTCAFFVHVNERRTSVWDGVIAPRHERGAAGIVVRSGEIKIRRLSVTARGTGESAGADSNRSTTVRKDIRNAAAEPPAARNGQQEPNTVNEPAGGLKLRKPNEVGFNPLFSGIDLHGWKNVRPGNGSDWSVTVDGILEGHGGGELGKGAVLLFDPRNFTNFVLRVKVRFRTNDNGGRIIIRQRGADDYLNGYHIKAGGPGQIPIGSIGSGIDGSHNWDRLAEPTPFLVDQWHTIEITAIKNKISARVDERGVLDFVDAAGRYTTGGIAVFCGWNSSIQIKDVLIKELPDDSVRPP